MSKGESRWSGDKEETDHRDPYRSVKELELVPWVRGDTLGQRPF